MAYGVASAAGVHFSLPSRQGKAVLLFSLTLILDLGQKETVLGFLDDT
jgi:hypothetical protein